VKAPFWNRIPKNEENHGGKRSWSNPGKTGTVLESIIEKWGKKDLAKTTPKKEKTRKREAIKQLAACHLELQRKGATRKNCENKG
jgi:hypothetical protein